MARPTVQCHLIRPKPVLVIGIDAMTPYKHVIEFKCSSGVLHDVLVITHHVRPNHDLTFQC